MKELLTLKDGRNIFYRPVGIDKENVQAKEDYDFSYDVAKRTVMDDVTSLAGEWPEEFQNKYFADDFYQDDTYILMCEGQRIGCFAIHEHDDHIELCKSYFEGDFQDKGIGQEILKISLKRAHENQKPLNIGVLTSNDDTYESSKRYGFIETQGLVILEEAPWVKMRILTHKDTLQYKNDFDPQSLQLDM